jgi:hypothetical protein
MRQYHFAKLGVKCALLLTALVSPALVRAQGYTEFVGGARTVPDRVTKEYKIHYNDRGFQEPKAHNTKGLIKRDAPQAVIDAVNNFPSANIGVWIDQAFKATAQEFRACGGSIAASSGGVSPSQVHVEIEPTIFYMPNLGINAASGYYPDQKLIRALNIYYIWSGPDAGWLRQAPDLLKWEMENFVANEVGLQMEPRTPHWPCDAPPAQN